jgi:ABC-type metal ion transport system, periplasmic component/surface adhesin
VALAQRMSELDRGNAAFYQQRLQDFQSSWTAAIAKWEQQATPLKGQSVVVQHKGFTYLAHWLGLREIAALEPKPGIEPTTAHLAEVLSLLQKQPAKMVLRAAYQGDQSSQWLAQRTKINVVTLPFTVGGTPGAKDLFGLFDDTIDRLLKGAQ